MTATMQTVTFKPVLLLDCNLPIITKENFCNMVTIFH